MWICLNNSFVSIVKDRQVEGNLLVRARRRSHIQRFLGRAEGVKAVRVDEDRTGKKDYRFRVSVPRDLVARLLSHTVWDLDYDNFKGSVRDRELHDMYLLWWKDHHELQEK